jgi:Putative Flp pilus-assembly TadE/G-like
MRRKRGRNLRGDRGTLSLFVVMLVPAVVLMAGLLVDGGIAINAKERAADVAQQAARAGANDLDVADLRSGQVQLAPDACAVALNFVPQYQGIGAQAVGCQPGTAGNGDPVVTVQAKVVVHSQMLSLIGLGTFTETGSGSASPVCGITQGGQC